VTATLNLRKETVTLQVHGYIGYRRKKNGLSREEKGLRSKVSRKETYRMIKNKILQPGI
jgi:hypothetical protein